MARPSDIFIPLNFIVLPAILILFIKARPSLMPTLFITALPSFMDILFNIDFPSFIIKLLITGILSSVILIEFNIDLTPYDKLISERLT